MPQVSIDPPRVRPLAKTCCLERMPRRGASASTRRRQPNWSSSAKRVATMPASCRPTSSPQMLGSGSRSYLRTLMIHGAGAVLGKAGGKQDPRSQWIGRMRN